MKKVQAGAGIATVRTIRTTENICRASVRCCRVSGDGCIATVYVRMASGNDCMATVRGCRHTVRHVLVTVRGMLAGEIVCRALGGVCQIDRLIAEALRGMREPEHLRNERGACYYFFSHLWNRRLKSDELIFAGAIMGFRPVITHGRSTITSSSTPASSSRSNSLAVPCSHANLSSAS